MGKKRRIRLIDWDNADDFKEFDSIKECSEFLGLPRWKVVSVCKRCFLINFEKSKSLKFIKR